MISCRKDKINIHISTMLFPTIPFDVGYFNKRYGVYLTLKIQKLSGLRIG
jgi:hypothetical protein